MSTGVPPCSPTATTRLAAVIGSPVRHSLSPVLHNAAFAAVGLDWTYVALEVADGGAADALTGVRALGIAGLSVTMPHKAAVAAACDDLTSEARALGAVNCVTNRHGSLEGHNTDGPGFIDALAATIGFRPKRRRCLVLGAGGAARAIVEALASADAAEVIVVNRTVESAARAAVLAGGVGRVGSLDDLPRVDLVVNATSVGMIRPGASGRELPCDPAQLRPEQVLCDIVYHPAETALMAAARARGLTVVGGLPMLVHQAAHQFTRWTGADAPIAVMEQAARRFLGE